MTNLKQSGIYILKKNDIDIMQNCQSERTSEKFKKNHQYLSCDPYIFSCVKDQFKGYIPKTNMSKKPHVNIVETSMSVEMMQKSQRDVKDSEEEHANNIKEETKSRNDKPEVHKEHVNNELVTLEGNESIFEFDDEDDFHSKKRFSFRYKRFVDERRRF